MSSIDITPWGKRSTNMHPSAYHKTAAMALKVEGKFCFLASCCIMPIHAVVWFPDQSDDTTFHHLAPSLKNSLPLTAYHSSHCGEQFFCRHSCSSITK
jgi:hypothetical protein